MALDMAHLFAIWKLPILQLYNCKKKKKVSKDSVIFCLFRSWGEQSSRGEMGEANNKKQISLRTSMFPLL